MSHVRSTEKSSIQDEDEWRLINSDVSRQSVPITTLFRSVADRVVPYAEFFLGTSDLPILEIVLGASCPM